MAGEPHLGGLPDLGTAHCTRSTRCSPTSSCRSTSTSAPGTGRASRVARHGHRCPSVPASPSVDPDGTVELALHLQSLRQRRAGPVPEAELGQRRERHRLDPYVLERIDYEYRESSGREPPELPPPRSSSRRVSTETFWFEDAGPWRCWTGSAPTTCCGRPTSRTHEPCTRIR